MFITCEVCGKRYDEEFCSALCPHYPKEYNKEETDAIDKMIDDLLPPVGEKKDD